MRIPARLPFLLALAAAATSCASSGSSSLPIAPPEEEVPLSTFQATEIQLAAVRYFRRNDAEIMCIGMMASPGLDEHQKALIAEKRAEFEARAAQQDAFSESPFPEGAQLCSKCNMTAVVMMDGCMTCLNCGDSKCG